MWVPTRERSRRPRSALKRFPRPDRGERFVDCNEVLDQLAEYLDDDARAELCRAIEEHLSQCHGCKIEVDSVRKTIVLYQADRECPCRRR